MGVYIYMEMPPDGRYTVCVTHDSHGVVHWVFQNQDTLEFLKHGAVTEVPEPHGRIGDLDELYASLEKWLIQNRRSMTEATRVWIRGILEGIAATPTIIPASEEG